MSDLLNPREASERLAERNVKVTPRTVRRWIDRGAIPSIALPNGRRVIRAQDLAAVLDGTAPDTESVA